MTPDQQQREGDLPSGRNVAQWLGDWSREIACTLGPDGKQCGGEEFERVAALSLASLSLSFISFLGFLAAISPPPPPPGATQPEKEAE